MYKTIILLVLSAGFVSAAIFSNIVLSKPSQDTIDAVTKATKPKNHQKYVT